MFLPKVKPDIYDSILASPFDADKFFERLRIENPEIARLFKVIQARGESISGAIVVYRLLSAQAEVDALEELFRYDP